MEAYISNVGEWGLDLYVRYGIWELVSYVAFGFILLNVLRMIFILANTYRNRNVKFSREMMGGKKILIAGDSTAVGTGAKNMIDTIAGRLSYDFPHTQIENVAVNGALTRDIMRQLDSVKDTKFDMIIISTGGNDVWHFSRIKRMRRDFRAVLGKAKEMCGGKVMVLFFGNEGSAPFFPFILRSFLMAHTEKVKNLLDEVTRSENVPLINLFEGINKNPFVENPKKYFASDGLHPSSDGYWLWYNRMWRLMIQKNYLYRDDEIGL